MRARQPRLGLMHAAAQAERAGHRRHHRLVAVVADAHLDAPVEVDAVDVLQEPVHEMLARLLAIGDDVDAGILLLLDGQQRRIALGRGKVLAGQLPWRPQHVRFGEPGGLGQAAGDRGLEHALLRDRAHHGAILCGILRARGGGQAEPGWRGMPVIVHWNATNWHPEEA